MSVSAQIAKDMTAINEVLGRFGLTPGAEFRGVPCFVTPTFAMQVPAAGFVWYRIQTPDGHEKVRRRERELNEALTIARNMVPTRVDWTEPVLGVRVRHPKPTTLLWDMVPADLEPYQFVVGRDYTSQEPAPMLLSLLDGNMAHILSSGATGSGKTVITKNALLSLMLSTPPEDLAVLIINPKPDEESGDDEMNDLPHMIAPIVTDPEEVAVWLRRVMALKERRKKRGRRGEPRLLVNIQEVTDLGSSLPIVVDFLADILPVGRTLGIHVIADTQHPLTDVIGSQGKANFQVLNVAKTATAQQNQVVAPGWGLQAHLLPGRGAFYCIVAGEVHYAQSHMVDAEIVAAVSGEIRGKWAGQATLSLPSADGGGGEMTDAEKILDAFSVDDLFDEDGTVKFGVKTALAKTLFGDNARAGGWHLQKVDAALDEIGGRI